MDKKLLGRRINAARRERGWTSERLSEICNINATYLRQIESGAKTPSLQVFVELCEALKVSPTYLLADSLPGAESQDLDALLNEPSIPTLRRLCAAFGITMAQFFTTAQDTEHTKEQQELIDSWERLSEEKRQLLSGLIKIMI